MLPTLSRVKPPRWLSPDILSRYILGHEVRGNELSLFSHSISPKSAAWRLKVTAGIRNVSTSCTLCAKARGNQKKKDMSEKKLTRHFIDYRRVKLMAGSGGKGACCFHSEPRKEWGGPDGGNGGDGGNIIIKAQHERGMDEESEKLARILWDYLRLHHRLEKSDVIIGLGCHDLRVAERSAALFLEGWAPWLLFTGNLGKQTAGVWTRREADVFLDVALRMGVPRGSILLETEATNTGENIRFSHRVLKERNIPASRVILVQQPFMERRVYATFLRQWPEQVDLTRAIVTSPELGIFEYPHPAVGTACDLICYMLGVVERIRDYPHKGFQVEQQLPPSVLCAYNWLLQAGYSPK
ncbi:uncharacterized protein SCO4629 isoform X2 [Lates calcarifer]|uniref:Uncharacterized protein SCO4629 isoform X2 n=1 Tax=Lates calcarifer TaxID=8187 RepID=A0AAJ7VJ88_LATCA|nr:uncharacterized protein SCO4629 isoform X2 [Lates calcarifer]